MSGFARKPNEFAIQKKVLMSGKELNHSISFSDLLSTKSLHPQKITTHPMNTKNPQYFTNRAEWRKWLSGNFDKEKETWFVFASKGSGKPTVSYNDAVEEALCFGWIDSVMNPLDKDHHMQRFTPRRAGSAYSQPNIERLKWLLEQNLVHPTLVEEMEKIANQEFVFPDDILEVIKSDAAAWKNYQHFTESYKRIRIAYIDGARKHPEIFAKRLNHFISKTRENKLIIGHGGIDKYYK
jgi:uncharacterized protein YdeI (YjbR/CyaY-like superfamily)